LREQRFFFSWSFAHVLKTALAAGETGRCQARYEVRDSRDVTRHRR
jgi:hypothetical protein